MYLATVTDLSLLRLSLSYLGEPKGTFPPPYLPGHPKPSSDKAGHRKGVDMA